MHTACACRPTGPARLSSPRRPSGAGVVGPEYPKQLQSLTSALAGRDIGAGWS